MKDKFFLVAAIIICSIILVSCPEDPVSPLPTQIEIFIASVQPSPLEFMKVITIKGLNFDSTRSNSSLMINDRALDSVLYKSWNDSIIKFYLPPWAQNGLLYVQRGKDISNKVQIEILDYPVVLRVEPGMCFPGDTVYVYGRFFGSYQSESDTLQIYKKNTKPISWNDTLISFVTDKFHEIYDIEVSVKVIKGAKYNIYHSYRLYNYPKIIKVNPKIVTHKSKITIEGSNLKNYHLFSFDENPELFLNDKKITDISFFEHNGIVFKIPADAVSGNLMTKRYGRSSNLMPLTVARHPEILAINPDESTSGTEVTINGRQFTNIQGKVYFNLTESEVVQWTDTQIRCRVPDINNCAHIYVEINELKSNEILFKMPGCKTINDYPIKYVDVQSFMGPYTDTLKYENGVYKFKLRKDPYKQDNDYSLVSVEFDTQTLNLKKVVLEYKFVEMGGNGIIGHHKITLYRYIAEQIPVQSFTGNSLDYSINKNFAAKISIDYFITGSWTNSKTGESGKYDEKGTVNPESMSTYNFHFY